MSLQAALLQARALVAQLEALTEPPEPPEPPPPEPGRFCSLCGSTKVRRLERAPEEEWRIRCEACQSVTASKAEAEVEA